MNTLDMLDTARWETRSGLSRNTIRKYSQHVEAFKEAHNDFLVLSEAEQISAVKSFIYSRNNSGLPANDPTIIQRRSALCSLFDFLQQEGVLGTNIAREVGVPSINIDGKAKALSDKSLDTLFDWVYRRGSLRDQAVLEVLYASGLRRTEAATMRVRNFMDEQTLVITGKGNKKRTTIISEKAFELVSDYFKDVTGDKLDLTAPANTPIWYTRGGKPVPTLRDPGFWIWRIVRRCMDACGVEGGPHSLRHSFATSLWNAGLDIALVGQLLGHSSLETTRRVYTSVNKAALNTALRMHPRGNR